MADRLRASIFFFELESVTQQDGVWTMDGHICCRLRPGEQGFRELLERTKSCMIQGIRTATYKIPTSLDREKAPVRLYIKFKEQSLVRWIRGDANFGDSHSVTISGFPMELSVS